MGGVSVVDSFMQGCTAEQKRLVRNVVSAIREADASLSAAVRWNQLTFAKGADYHHWICALRITKRSVNLYFHFGGLLDDPGNLLKAGSSKFGRWLTFETEFDIRKSDVKKLVGAAVQKLPYFKANWKAIQAGSG